MCVLLDGVQTVAEWKLSEAEIGELIVLFLCAVWGVVVLLIPRE